MGISMFFSLWRLHISYNGSILRKLFQQVWRMSAAKRFLFIKPSYSHHITRKYSVLMGFSMMPK